LNALTYIAVINGHAYAVNGYAKDWAARYSIRSGEITMAVQDRDDPIDGDQSPLFDGIESIKGCNLPMHNGIANTIAEAVEGHQCLGE
jgi:hypothetical protein